VLRSMQLSSVARWRSSERIAEEILRQLGFEILEHHKRIVVEGLEIGEVDFVARSPEGTLYAVEVKAGKIDITGLRQAYVNAVLLGMKPLVICKGFADDSARELAKTLGIEVVQLSEFLVTEDEELETIVREAVEDALGEYIEMLMLTPTNIKESHLRILEAVAKCSSPNEVAEALKMDVHEVLKALNEMRSSGILPRWAKKWSSLRRVAKLIYAKIALQKSIETLADVSSRLGNLVAELSKNTSILAKALSSLTKTIEALQRSTEELQRWISERGITSPAQPVVNSSHEGSNDQQL